MQSKNHVTEMLKTWRAETAEHIGKMEERIRQAALRLATDIATLEASKAALAQIDTELATRDIAVLARCSTSTVAEATMSATLAAGGATPATTESNTRRP